ncbi:MAG TPA: hypothetical protein VGG33_12570 [Polyangia bacterium]
MDIDMGMISGRSRPVGFFSGIASDLFGLAGGGESLSQAVRAEPSTSNVASMGRIVGRVFVVIFVVIFDIPRFSFWAGVKERFGMPPVTKKSTSAIGPRKTRK